MNETFGAKILYGAWDVIFDDICSCSVCWGVEVCRISAVCMNKLGCSQVVVLQF